MTTMTTMMMTMTTTMMTATTLTTATTYAIARRVNTTSSGIGSFDGFLNSRVGVYFGDKSDTPY